MRLRHLAYLAALVAGSAFAQQQQIYCYPLVPCDPVLGPINTGRGDQPYQFNGKTNQNFEQLYGMFGTSTCLETTGTVCATDLTAFFSTNSLAVVNLPASLSMTGAPSLTNRYLYTSANFAGMSLSGAPSMQGDGLVSPFDIFVRTDTVDSVTNGIGYINLFSVMDQVRAGATGGRTAVSGNVQVTGTPTTGTAGYVGTNGLASASVNMGGTTGAYANYAGGLFGMNGNAFTISGATFLKLVQGAEFDSTLGTGSSSADHYGVSVVEGSAQAVRAAYDDTAIKVASQDGISSGNNWQCGLCFGAYAHAWAFDTDSTLIGVKTRVVPSPTSSVFKYGVDLRSGTITAGGLAFASPGFGVDPSGNTNALTVQLNTSFTVSTLPTCNTAAKGTLAYVTDATAPTYNATLSGSGAVITLAFCNGTNWTAH